MLQFSNEAVQNFEWEFCPSKTRYCDFYGFLTAAFPFFEGDIVLDGKLKAQLDKVKAKVKAKFKDLKSKVKGKFDSLRRRLGRRSRRSIVKPASRHWKYGIIPYEIDQNLSKLATKPGITSPDIKEMYVTHKH